MNLEDYRELFPITRERIFLDHAAGAPSSLRVAEALRAYLEQAQALPFDLIQPHPAQRAQELRGRLAALIGAAGAEEIALLPHAAALNTVASSLPLRAGESVLLLEGEERANQLPWLNLAARGVVVKRVPTGPDGLAPDALERWIDPRTRALVLSSALFATGLRPDLAAAGRLCRERGLLFVVDASQTLGVFALDVQATGIDLLVCAGDRWLLGAPGSGFLYCRQALLDTLQPGAYVGPAGTRDPYGQDGYNFTLLPDARRFQLSRDEPMAVVALHAALDLLHEVGLVAVGQRVRDLTELLVSDLRDRGFHLRLPAPPLRGGMVVLDLPDPARARARLEAARVVATLRGARLHLAPHFYNTEQDVLRVGQALGTAG